MSDWFLVLADQLGKTPFLHWIVFVLGVWHVLLAKANSVWLYPVGMATASVVFYNSLDSAHYASMAFCIYYLAMLGYGWMCWTARPGQAVPVSYANHVDWWTTLAVAATGFAVLYLILAFAMKTAFPVWEAGVGGAACAGVWLLNSRKIEHWVLLNISQAVAIPLLFYKEQFLYGSLSLFLYIFAFFGFFSWRRIIHQQRHFVRV